MKEDEELGFQDATRRSMAKCKNIKNWKEEEKKERKV